MRRLEAGAGPVLANGERPLQVGPKGRRRKVTGSAGLALAEGPGFAAEPGVHIPALPLGGGGAGPQFPRL